MGSLRCSPELVQRQLERCVTRGADIDVLAIAKDIDETAKHGTVRNPDGLLVHRVTQSLSLLADRRRAHDREVEHKRERYARLWVQILRVVSQRQLSPPLIGGLLRAARRNGFPDLNPRVADLLLEMGSDWPPEADAGGEPVASGITGGRRA